MSFNRTFVYRMRRCTPNLWCFKPPLRWEWRKRCGPVSSASWSQHKLFFRFSPQVSQWEYIVLRDLPWEVCNVVEQTIHTCCSPLHLKCEVVTYQHHSNKKLKRKKHLTVSWKLGPFLIFDLLTSLVGFQIISVSISPPVLSLTFLFYPFVWHYGAVVVDFIH